MVETTQTYIKDALANDKNELESIETIENFLIKVLKNQFPNCYVTCTYNMAYLGIDITIKGFKNDKLCALRKMFIMEVINDEASLMYALDLLAKDWMVIE